MGTFFVRSLFPWLKQISVALPINISDEVDKIEKDVNGDLVTLLGKLDLEQNSDWTLVYWLE